MHCWFCENPLRRGPAGFYCPFAACPAIKDDAGWAVLNDLETERWWRMKEAGTLRRNLLEAGLLEDPSAEDG